MKKFDRGVGPYAGGPLKFKQDKSINSSGNPIRRPQQALPKDGQPPRPEPLEKPAEVTSMGMSRPLQKSPIKRYFV